MKDNIALIVSNKDVKKIRELFNENYPIDIALALEEVDDDVLKNFMFSISNTRLASILEVAEPEFQLRMLEKLPFRRVALLFQQMSNDDVVDILGNLPVGIRKRYINMMKQSSQDDIQTMLNYAPDTAGGIMTTEYITVKEQLTVEETLSKLREISPNSEVINIIFVTSLQRKLIGWIDIRDLFTHDLDESLHDVMHTNIISVLPEEDQEEVARISTKYDLSVVPVVNKQNVLLGIITIDDIVHVLQEEHHEDMLLISGVEGTERIGGPFKESIQKRTPWLLINLITAFMASAVVGLFQDTIEQVVVLAVAMPIITGMGGNSASQTLALVIQEVAIGQLTWEKDKKYVLNEIWLGLVNGIITGIFAAIALYIPYQNFFLSIIVILAMAMNLMVGAFFGFFVPLLLKKLNLDPAISSTIFVTTATDVLGFFIFLYLAELFLPLLL